MRYVYSAAIARAETFAPETWAEIEQLARELKDRAVLPVIGAGGSFACGSEGAATLAEELYAKVANGGIKLDSPPEDIDRMRSDLGKMADAISLEHSPTAVLENLGFRDEHRWPTPNQVFERYQLEAEPHRCVYRVLARMAKERLLAESISFNYDCHYEGALLKEGFFSPRRATHHNRWPEFFTVVADAESHASLAYRGEFVLNKVHGCVQTWRQRVEIDEQQATSSIIIRWSQLLDWRDDRWARDLFHDRARRHILMLIGFSGLDPVIQSTLQAVMREVGLEQPKEGTARVRAIDVAPDTLTLRLLLRAGGGDDVGSVRALRVSEDLAATMLVLCASMVRSQLEDFARDHSRAACLSIDHGPLLRRLAISGPAMLRWTWSILAHRFGSPGLTGLRERGDDYYIPLTADPLRTLEAFSIREELAARFGIAAELDAYTDAGSFLTVTRAGKALMPLGLHDYEVAALADGSRDLPGLAIQLRSPSGELDRAVVGRDPARKLRAFSLETSAEIPL